MPARGERALRGVIAATGVNRGGWMRVRSVADLSGVALDIGTKMDEPRFRALTGSTKNLGVNRRHRQAGVASSLAGAPMIQPVDHETFFSTTH